MSKHQQTLDQALPWGIALLRIVVGVVFFMHGLQKLFQMGVPGVSGFFASLGIPAPEVAAVVVSLVETVGGLALILGVLTPSRRRPPGGGHAGGASRRAPAEWVLRR